MTGSKKGSKRRVRKRAGMGAFAMGVGATYIATKLFEWHIKTREAYYQGWEGTPDPDPPKEFIDFIESSLIQGGSMAIGGVSAFLSTNCTQENIWNVLSGGTRVAVDSANVLSETVQAGNTWLSGYFREREVSPDSLVSLNSDDSTDLATQGYVGHASSKPSGNLTGILRQVFKDEIRMAGRKTKPGTTKGKKKKQKSTIKKKKKKTRKG